MIDKIRAFLYSSDEITWVGHAVQGLLVMAVFAPTVGRGAGMLALLYHAIAREIEGIYDAARHGDTRKLRDGIFDAGAFFFGAAIYALIASLI